MMEQIIEEVMKVGDKTKETLFKTDEILQNDNKDAEELEEIVRNLNLDTHQRIIVNDYVACLQSSWSRVADLSYLAGIKDTLTLLSNLDLLVKQS